MAALKFASSHNMVAFLDKPTESNGFEQIVDFLNAHPIKYALTVNPTIYTACIEQFWATTKVRIYQKSQENRQKRANTDMRNGRAQKKPRIQSQSQKKSSLSQRKSNPGQTKSTHKRTNPKCFISVPPSFKCYTNGP
ncbi:hypothetical protein Tco_0262540 [Tanacetum coccineum]